MEVAPWHKKWEKEELAKMTKKEQPVGQEENKERELEEAARGKSD